MIKKILTDRELLSQMCDEVGSSYEALDVITDLKDTAVTLNNCAGLAAPQIGHFVRVIYVKVQGKAVIMVNPEIVETKGKFSRGQEGCFSVPATLTRPRQVKRWFKVKVSYWTEGGDLVTQKFKGFEARLIQHEVDHLNGILI